MSSRKLRLIVLTAAALTAVAVAFVAAMATSSTASSGRTPKALGGEPGEATFADRFASRKGEGVSAEDFRAATRAYPADQVDVSWVQNAKSTFARIASRTPRAPNPPPNPALLNVWQNYGPQMHATEPGALAFAGATNNTASRTASIAISPTCGTGLGAFPCRVWVGPVGGGVWRTDDATAPDPVWTPVGQGDLGINSIGDLALDPNDSTQQTLYAGTGEPNNCSSGCVSGVGLYRSTNGGNSWAKVAGTCVSGAIACTTPGGDSFIGRGISEIVVEPGNPSHLFVGTANAIRSMSHVNEGPDAQVRDEPGSNPTALYESTNGGATFSIVWNPYTVPANTPLRRGVMDIGLDPSNSSVVYASATERGLWRRCPTVATSTCGGETGAGATDFKQVFKPRRSAFGSRERTHFDLTTKNGLTRIYLTTGALGSSAPPAGEAASSFWRTDNANQTAAALLATEPAGAATVPTGNAGPGNPFPAVYNGWQILTANSTASPYWATRNFCEPQCWYDQDVFTPKNPPLPDTVYTVGSFQYGEVPCYTKGVGCGSGISNGRAVLYSTTAGDPDPNVLNRTFTDMTMDGQNVPASWCAFNQAAAPCLVAHHGIHPDQHEIVINPGKPTQFLEGSDGGINRSNGSFVNLSRACFFRDAPTLGVPALSGNALTQCQRVLSRVPNTLGDVNTRLGNTLQFINVAVDPLKPCNIIGGTQDNGTWMPAGDCDSDDFRQVIYGDGGVAAFDTYYDQSSASNGEAWVANEYTSGANNVNFHNGSGVGDKWLDVFYPPLLNGDLFNFYWPQISDPNPPLFNGTTTCNQFLPACVRTHPLYSGGQHVWRSWAWGAGDQGQIPQDVTPDIATYEANCSDLYVTPTTCGDFQAMGGSGFDAPGDLTGTFYGSDRVGLPISWISRRAADRTNMWATTGNGRVFITRNADAVDPANVVWERIDSLSTPAFSGNCPVAGGGVNPTAPPGGSVNCSPTRHPNGIYPDPGNPDVAYIAYSGYNAATPGTPGHLFRVTITRNGAGVATGATFTNLGIEAGTSGFPTPTGTGDLPVNDVVMNDSNGALYAATDFGVLKGTPAGGGTFSWATTPGMPRFEITHLAMTPGQRDACRVCGSTKILYASTHSMGIWLMKLS